ncbi:Uncharacterised protein [Vibrio cholerae]|nr:Uncharacterised protein [Vibrio cholerae]
MGLVLQIRSYRCSHGTANLIALRSLFTNLQIAPPVG